jgi:hypothetical protein
MKAGVVFRVYIQAMKLSESLRQLGHPVVFYPKLADIFGMQESVLLSHFIFWGDKGHDPEGWIYKSVEEIEEETGLSYEQQRRAVSVLTRDTGSLKGHHKTKRSVSEPVLKKRYDRTNHRMYFKVDIEAVDRVFSQGHLFPMLRRHLGNPQVPPGLSLGATRGFPRSSITDNTSESTTYISRKRKISHSSFVKWWDDAVMRIRGRKAKWSPADFLNLKRALEIASSEKLESMALFYLADRMFAEYPPQMHTFLSAGVFKAIHSENGFWNKVEGYYRMYYEQIRPSRFNQKESNSDLDNIRKSIAEKLAKRFSI